MTKERIEFFTKYVGEFEKDQANLALKECLEEIERLQAAMQGILEIATGERQVANDDTEGLGIVAREVQAALEMNEVILK